MYPSENRPRIIVRLPHELKDWLEVQAAQNSSSQNSEIIRCIRERMERVQTMKGSGYVQSQ